MAVVVVVELDVVDGNQAFPARAQNLARREGRRRHIAAVVFVKGRKHTALSSAVADHRKRIGGGKNSVAAAAVAEEEEEAKAAPVKARLC